MYLREKTGSEFIQILPAAVYHVYRMSTKMGKENNWGTRDGGRVTTASAGEMYRAATNVNEARKAL